MSKRGSRDSVLIIDDDPDLRTLIGTLGEMCRVPVIEAPDCVTALNVLANEASKLKLILLDYFMPGMTPAQCADAIVAKAGATIPVVLLTAAFDPAARAAELKLTRWISKPFEVSELIDLMTQAPAFTRRS
jgi:CheY-like chemotaxis protein